MSRYHEYAITTKLRSEVIYLLEIAAGFLRDVAFMSQGCRHLS